MELIKVSASKLKVILSLRDFERLGQTCGEFDYESGASKRVFREILDNAKHRVGFETKGSVLDVEFYPGRDGSAELYITKKASFIPSLGKDKTICGCVAKSKNLSNVINLLKRLFSSGFDSDCSLYYDNSTYYLHFPDAKPLQNHCYICEYADLFASDKLTQDWLSEHSKLIIGNVAAQVFGKIF